MLLESLRAQNRGLCVNLKLPHPLKQWIKFAIYHELQQNSNKQKAFEAQF